MREKLELERREQEAKEAQAKAERDAIEAKERLQREQQESAERERQAAERAAEQERLRIEREEIKRKSEEKLRADNIEHKKKIHWESIRSIQSVISISDDDCILLIKHIAKGGKIS